MNSKYASFESSNVSTSTSSSSGDYERDLTLKWKPNATFRGVLDACYGGDNQWGQSLGIKFTDGKLVDGVLMERLGADGEPDGTVKLFAWEQMPVVLNEELSADDAPDVFTEEIGTKNYRYQLLGARVEGDEENGIEADPADPIDFGDFIMWEDGGQKPSSTAKVLAQTLTPAGREIIVDKDDIHNWLDVGAVELREDLIGREVDVFKVIKQGPKHKFHSPVVIDVKTGKQIMIVSGRQDASSGSSAPVSAPASTMDSSEDSDEATSGMPGPVADFVEFCRDFGLTDEEQILTNLNEMAEESDNSLTPEMVESVGTDTILNAIVS
ncbi:hypothetical protein ACFQGT_09850 [Natrialbaceae archaeon GCM10025810]|uniref:hypothetical protein n=1 Tax=Halovalidus salilacus TaxID=3075124 RepID=UPI00361F3679